MDRILIITMQLLMFSFTLTIYKLIVKLTLLSF